MSSTRHEVGPYVVDTNLYIRATRNDDWSRELESFFIAFTPWVALHSVVALEVLAGAHDRDLERRTQARFIEPFERRGRVITPGHGAYVRAAGAIARLVRDKRIRPDGMKRSFVNDCLIAASARERGFTLVTDNLADFRLIGRVLPVRVVPPWPDPATAR